MKTCSQVELIVMRGLLCKLNCPDFQRSVSSEQMNKWRKCLIGS